MTRHLRKIAGPYLCLLLSLTLCAPAAQAQQVAGHVGVLDLTTLIDQSLTACLSVEAYHRAGDAPDVGTVLIHNNCEIRVAFAAGPWPLGAGDPGQMHSGGVIASFGTPGSATYRAGMALAVCDANQTEIDAVKSAVQDCAGRADRWHDRGGH